MGSRWSQSEGIAPPQGDCQAAKRVGSGDLLVGGLRLAHPTPKLLVGECEVLEGRKETIFCNWKLCEYKSGNLHDENFLSEFGEGLGKWVVLPMVVVYKSAHLAFSK